jgi:hypothetical protein
MNQEVLAMVNDGTYNYFGCANGNIYVQTISSGAVNATPIASVGGKIQDLTLNGTTLTVGVAGGSVYTVALASSGLTDGVVYIGPKEFQGYVGTWTMTREAAGRQSLVLTAATVDAFALVDITPIMRSMTSKGMKLATIQYAFGLGVANLTTHTINVTKTAFTDNAAPSTTDVLAATALYNTYGTVTSPYIRTATIAVPAWLNPLPSASEDDKWSIEVRANNPGTSTYRIYGMWLTFNFDYQ